MKGVYRWVPQQNWNQDWTDEALYKKYSITKEEIAFISSMIRPMGTCHPQAVMRPRRGASGEKG
jgi:hypothetical protein